MDIEAVSLFCRQAKAQFLANALLESIQDLNLKAMKYLLEKKKADPNLRLEELGASPLHFAAGFGDENTSVDMIRLCLANGGNPNIRSSDGMTPLHIAASWGRRQVLSFLIDNGGDPNMTDIDGCSPLDCLLDSTHQSNESSAGKSKLPISMNSKTEVSPQVEDVDSILTSHLEKFRISSHTISNDSVLSEFNNAFMSDDISSTDSNWTLCKGESPLIDVDSNERFFSFSTVSEQDSSAKQKISSMITTHDVDSKTDSSSASWIFTRRKPDGYEDRERHGKSVRKPPLRNGLPFPKTKPVGSTNLPSTAETSSQSGNVTGGSSSSCPTERLKYLLEKNNLVHGPILKSTKRVYVRQLKKLKDGQPCQLLSHAPPDYNDVVMATLNGKLLSCIEKWSPLETSMIDKIKEFSLREKKLDLTKQYFTYLLIDPSRTKGINTYCLNETDLCSSWECFLESVFYIGKGKNARPLDHLLDAVKCNGSSPSQKIKKIHDIWTSGYGVVCVFVFRNISELEALTREACMISTLSIGKLTNAVSGSFVVLKDWTLRSKRQLGVVLLYRAMMSLIAEGERQLFPHDLKKLVR